MAPGAWAPRTVPSAGAAAAAPTPAKAATAAAAAAERATAAMSRWVVLRIRRGLPWTWRRWRAVGAAHPRCRAQGVAGVPNWWSIRCADRSHGFLDATPHQPDVDRIRGRRRKPAEPSCFGRLVGRLEQFDEIAGRIGE